MSERKMLCVISMLVVWARVGNERGEDGHVQALDAVGDERRLGIFAWSIRHCVA